MAERGLLLYYLEHQPEWLVGAIAHQHFEEWGGVARGVITGFDTDLDLNVTIGKPVIGFTA